MGLRFSWRCIVAVFALTVVLFACAPPIVVAWRSIAGRDRWQWILGLSVLLMLAQGALFVLIAKWLLLAGAEHAAPAS